MPLASFTSAVAALALATGAAAASLGAAEVRTIRQPGEAEAASAAPRATVWTWPLDPKPTLVSGFDPPQERWGRGHRGVDLAAEVGQPVLAPTSGRISFAGTIAGRGVVVVVHAGGVRSTFEPVQDQARVGTAVQKGDVVAILGETAGHCEPATCLHWGVLRGDTYLNPLSFLTRRPIVLLPLQ